MYLIYAALCTCHCLPRAESSSYFTAMSSELLFYSLYFFLSFHSRCNHFFSNLRMNYEYCIFFVKTILEMKWLLLKIKLDIVMCGVCIPLRIISDIYVCTGVFLLFTHLLKLFQTVWSEDCFLHVQYICFLNF